MQEQVLGEIIKHKLKLEPEKHMIDIAFIVPS